MVIPVLPPGCAWCRSIADIGVSVADDEEDVEGNCEKGSAEQVPEGSEVGDGEVVGVVAHLPHPVHHPVTHEQQQRHLAAASGTKNVNRDWRVLIVDGQTEHSGKCFSLQ